MQINEGLEIGIEGVEGVEGEEVEERKCMCEKRWLGMQHPTTSQYTADQCRDNARYHLMRRGGSSARQHLWVITDNEVR